MFIIIEGLDKTGKSTLANYILKNMPNTILMKNGEKPKNSSVEERAKISHIYSNILDIYNTYFKDSIFIVDRFLLSEWVYSIKRGYEAIDDIDLSDLAEKLSIMGDVILIYCETTREMLVQRFKEDKEEYALISEIEMLNERYEKFVPELKVVYKLPYNFTRTSPEQVVKQLKLYKELLEIRKNKDIGMS